MALAAIYGDSPGGGSGTGSGSGKGKRLPFKVGTLVE
jgi:hypothetical protein